MGKNFRGTPADGPGANRLTVRARGDTGGAEDGRSTAPIPSSVSVPVRNSPADPAAVGPVLCACPACRRQWDATGLAPATELRCTCGALFTVPAHAVRSPRVFRCGSCGANLPAEGRACSYCAAEITLEERGLSGVCPGCGARLGARAHFCMECGLAIQPQRLSALRSGVACPRCRGTLRVREIGSASAIECASCAGLWISQSQLEDVCARAEHEDLAAQALAFEEAAPAPVSSAREGYIPCLTCGELMLRKNFGGSSGVVVDLCKHHGVWLDHRELGRILAFVRGGGLVRARAREVERLEREAERARHAASPPVLGPAGGGFGTDRSDLDPDLLGGLAWLAGKLLRGLRR